MCSCHNRQDLISLSSISDYLPERRRIWRALVLGKNSIYPGLAALIRVDTKSYYWYRCDPTSSSPASHQPVGVLRMAMLMYASRSPLLRISRYRLKTFLGIGPHILIARVLNRQLSSESLTCSTNSLGPTMSLQLILILIISYLSTISPPARLTRPGPSYLRTRIERSQMVSQGVAPGMMHSLVAFRPSML